MRIFEDVLIVEVLFKQARLIETKRRYFSFFDLDGGHSLIRGYRVWVFDLNSLIVQLTEVEVKNK